MLNLFILFENIFTIIICIDDADLILNGILNLIYFYFVLRWTWQDVGPIRYQQIGGW